MADKYPVLPLLPIAQRGEKRTAYHAQRPAQFVDMIQLGILALLSDNLLRGIAGDLFRRLVPEENTALHVHKIDAVSQVVDDVQIEFFRFHYVYPFLAWDLCSAPFKWLPRR